MCFTAKCPNICQSKMVYMSGQISLMCVRLERFNFCKAKKWVYYVLDKA